uniref:Ig-like domain-containing protein n=1 Tax=Geospiza parvula TaxID=87175 RepID=A0A8C3MNK7_GEOPR
MAMGRGAAAGALLVALVVLGAPPAAGAELSGVFQELSTSECYFINGTEKVRFVERYIYNRQPYAVFDSDVGHYVGFTPYGEMNAKRWNSDPELMEDRRTSVDTYCRHNYEVSRPATKVPPSAPKIPPSATKIPSLPARPGRLLCSVMDFYPAAIQVRWFQGQQELSEHVVATDVVPNGDWTYQLLVLLETPPRRGLSYSCQVEHVSLEQPLRRHWGTGEPLGARAEPLGCAGSRWEGAGESRAGAGRGAGAGQGLGRGLGDAGEGGMGLGGAGGTGREFGGAGCDRGSLGCWV